MAIELLQSRIVHLLTEAAKLREHQADHPQLKFFEP
jgi:hypothetical protein